MRIRTVFREQRSSSWLVLTTFFCVVSLLSGRVLAETPVEHSPSDQLPGPQTLMLRDAETGLGLAGTMTIMPLERPMAPLASEIDQVLDDHRATTLSINRLVELPASVVQSGSLALRVQAPGYRTMHAVLRSAPSSQGWTVMLDPLIPTAVPSAQADDRLILSGFVHDRKSLEPVAAARVRVVLQNGELAVRGQTDPNGYFALEMPAPRIVDERPEGLSIRVTASGYPEWRDDDLLMGSGGARLQVGLGQPAPSTPHRQQMSESVWPEADPGPRLQLPQARGLGDQPPVSIQVGFGNADCTQSCCTGSCPFSCTLSLEEYTRRGLPKEWIASWAQDALAAGAVAYRSYGAWHVFNPPAHGAYDVCSSACCQVNAPGTVASTNQAASTTAGLMLVRNGGVFRSEYSSQNNCLQGQLSCTNSDLSCGNGFAGSPETGWPCLADPVGTDRPCFGHGRGMSQWGNQLWTLASPPRNWNWQLGHYYNASGNGSGLRTALVSQVLVIDAVRVVPGAGAGSSGTVIGIELDVRNLAAETHEHVLIGASLRQPPGPFINDPDNDQPVSLPPGPSTVSRQFVIPPDTQGAAFDVYASLYIDVDQNQAISSDDLAQHLVVLPQGLDLGLFADRFEQVAF